MAMTKRHTTRVTAVVTGGVKGQHEGGRKSLYGDDDDIREMYTEEEKDLFRQKLETLRQPRKDLLLTSSPTIHALLALPPDMLYDRMVTVLSNIGLVHTLILASVFGVASSPLNIAELPDSQQRLGEVFNFLNLINGTTCIMGSLGSVYLISSISTLSPEMIQRALLHLGSYLLLELMTAWVCMITVASWVIVFGLNSSSTRFTYFAGTIAFGLVCGCYTHILYMGKNAIPVAFSRWVNNVLGIPCLWGESDTEKANHLGHITYASASYHIGDKLDAGSGHAAGDRNGDGKEDDADEALAAEQRRWREEELPRLRAVVDDALAAARASEERRELVAEALLREDLTVNAMAAALRLDGGANALFLALDLEDGALAMQKIRRGERLAIINAVKARASDS